MGTNTEQCDNLLYWCSRIKWFWINAKFKC